MCKALESWRAFLLVVLSFLFLVPPSGAEPGPYIGKEAPDFRLKPVGGGTPLVLSNLKGKPVVLVFWAAWCGPCKKEIPALKDLYMKYAPKGVVFVSVAVGWRQKEEDVSKFQAAQQLPYQVLWDKDNEVAEQYQVRSIPTNIILDQDGVVRFRDFGLSAEADTVLSSMVKADN